MTIAEKLNKFRGCDYHIHPNYSIDAEGNIEQFVRIAIQKGLKKICFTTHIDLDPARFSVDRYIRNNGRLYVLNNDIVRNYREQIEQMRKKYAHEIDIVYGFEFSYEKYYEDKISEFIQKFKPEFSIGSVHSVDSMEITSRKSILAAVRCFQPYSFMRKYYEVVTDLAQSELFSVIGHIDGYKKYLSKFWGLNEIERMESEILPEFIPQIARTGVEFEINSSAYKKGLPSPYPAANVIRCLVENGMQIGSIGSDAHSPDMVGYLIDNAINYTQGALIEITHLRK